MSCVPLKTLFLGFGFLQVLPLQVLPISERRNHWADKPFSGWLPLDLCEHLYWLPCGKHPQAPLPICCIFPFQSLRLSRTGTGVTRTHGPLPPAQEGGPLLGAAVGSQT